MAQRPQRSRQHREGRRALTERGLTSAVSRCLAIQHPAVLSEALQTLFDDASGHLALGELDEATALYRKCVEIDATHFDSWHALSMVLLKTGQLKEALGASLQATSLQPNDLLAWTALSQIYVRLGDIPNAESAKANSRILSLGGRVVR